MLKFPKNKSLVIPLSGGIDSSLLVYAAKEKGIRIRLVHFYFGKPSSDFELSSAKRTAWELSLPFEIIDIRGAKNMQYGYLGDEDIEEDELDVGGFKSTPISGFYVLLSLSVYYTQLTKFDALAVGITKEQTKERENIGDSFKLFRKSIDLFNPSIKSPEIVTPLIGLTKEEILKISLKKKIPLEDTRSCTSGLSKPCGKCYSCKERMKAFKKLKMKDPSAGR